MITVVSKTPEETFAFGKELGSRLKKVELVCFFGDLAAGKTTLIKGLAAGAAGIPQEQVNSPTFVLLNIYEGTKVIYHFDLYRLEDASSFFSLGFEEYWHSGICCIEWAERIESILPKNALLVQMRALNETTREIRVEGLDVKGS